MLHGLGEVLTFVGIFLVIMIYRHMLAIRNEYQQEALRWGCAEQEYPENVEKRKVYDQNLRFGIKAVMFFGFIAYIGIIIIFKYPTP